MSLLLSVGFGCAGEVVAEPPTAAERHTAFPGSHLLALGGDQLLLWEPAGRAQLRTGSGTWTPEFRLPLQRIVAAQADDAGYLIAGSPAPGSAAVVLMSPVGTELLRWALPDDGAYALTVDSRGRRATTRRGVTPLNGDGTTGALEANAELHVAHGGGLPTAIDRPDGRAICFAADASEAHRAPGVCARVGAREWHFDGQFSEPPLSCGGWLVVGDGSESGAPLLTLGLMVRSWDTGELNGSDSFPVHPALACAGPNELLVGERQLALLRLPSLEIVWSRHLEGSSPVREVAVMRSFFAYRVEGSLEVVLVPRPPSI